MTSRVNLKTLQLVFKMVGEKNFTMTVNNIIVDVFFSITDKGELIVEWRFMPSAL